MLCEKNTQLTELQFYIKKIIRFLGIVETLSARIQYHQCYILIKCDTLIMSQLYTTYNHIRWDCVLPSISDHYTNPTNTLLIIMPHYTNTWPGSTENLTISTEFTTIPTSPSPFVDQYKLGTKLQSIFARFDAKCDKQYAKCDKNLNNLKSNMKN